MIIRRWAFQTAALGGMGAEDSGVTGENRPKTEVDMMGERMGQR